MKKKALTNEQQADYYDNISRLEGKQTHTHNLTHTITYTRGLETKQQQNKKRKKVPMGLTLFWMLRSAPAATRACTHSTLPLPAAAIRAVSPS